MDRKEQEIMDRIKDRAEEIKAPDSLSPDRSIPAASPLPLSIYRWILTNCWNY